MAFQEGVSIDQMIEGLKCLLETPKMAAVPRRLLKEHVTSLLQEQDRVMGALDFLFNGY